jgi:predicted RecA/RadA family phage recombinase
MPGCRAPVRRGRTHVLPYTPFAFACLADELTASARNLDVYLHAFLVGIETGGGRIEAARIATWERRVELAARAVVDTSGDAVVAHLAGVATMTAPLAERQLASLVFVLQQVDTEALGPGPRVALLKLLVTAEQEGRLPKGAANLALALSPQPGEVVCKLALSGITEELPASGDFLTLAEQEGRRRALAVTQFLKTLPAFARAFVSHAAPQVGVRESRRAIGRYQLTREDVVSGRKFEDGIARASWPIELWEEGRLGATYEFLTDGTHYDIPLRCLQARDIDNLFVAGRCMSATHEALGSARVIGTCLATGEAVGRAAARSAGTR